jgi:hypothetical protein
MADWTAFATAFLNDTAGYINERKDKAEEYTEKQRDLSEKNLLVMQKRKQISTTVGGIAKRLIDQGVPEEVVRTAAAAGPTGLTDLDKKWSTAIIDYGADFASANPELVSTMVSTNLSAEQLGMGAGAGAMSLDDFISSQYGLSKTTTGDYKAEETGVFRRMMGYNATDRARQSLDEEMAGMGMSVYDINQAAKMADFESAVPGASVMYGKTPKKFTAADMTDELVQYGRLEATLKTNENYIEAQATLETLLEKRTNELGMNREGSDAYKKITLEIDKQKAIIADLKARTYGPLIRARADSTFGDSYLSIMGPVLTERNIPLESYMGGSPISKDSTVTGDGSTVTGGGSAETGGDSTVKKGRDFDADMDPFAGTTYAQPNILRGAPFTVKTDENGSPVVVLQKKITNETTGQTLQEGTVVPPDQSKVLINMLQITDPAEFKRLQEQLGVTPLTEQQYDDMDRQTAKDLGLRKSVLGKAIQKQLNGGLANEDFQYSLSVKQNADPDTMYRVYIPQFAGKTREFAVKGSDLEFFSDGVLAAARNPVRIMGVAAEGDNLRSVSTKRLEKKFGKRPSERTEEEEKGEGFLQRQADKLNLKGPYRGAGKKTSKNLGPIPADEDQEKVLNDHGGTIMRAFKERGLTAESSDREFEKALTEWSYDNQVEMPFNRGPIIYALKLFIGDGE